MKNQRKVTAFDKIKVREDYYEALMKGYLSEMKDLLTDSEKASLFYSGQFMIQGLRFLSDYLNDDVYYPIKYPEHSLNPAKNQFVLSEEGREERGPGRCDWGVTIKSKND